jgi:hypothetical protein
MMIYARERPTQSSSHMMPRLHPYLSEQSQFSWMHFLAPKVLRGKSFRMLKTLRRMWRPKWTLFPWLLPTVFWKRLFLNRSNTCNHVGGDILNRTEEKLFPFFHTTYIVVGLTKTVPSSSGVEKCRRIFKQLARLWRTLYPKKCILLDVVCLSPTPLTITPVTLTQNSYVDYEIKGTEPFRRAQ